MEVQFSIEGNRQTPSAEGGSRRGSEGWGADSELLSRFLGLKLQRNLGWKYFQVEILIWCGGVVNDTKPHLSCVQSKRQNDSSPQETVKVYSSDILLDILGKTS